MNTSSTIRVLELRSVRGTGGGPEKTILLGAARSDPRRFRTTVCYVRDRRDAIFRIDAKARELGVDYVEIVERNSFDPSIWRPLTRLVRERHIDIVHAHDYKTDLLALMISKRTGIIPVTTVHGWSGTSRRERLYYFADRLLIPHFRAAIAVSKEIGRTLVSHGTAPERVYCIPNGIDSAVFARDVQVRRRIRTELSIPDDVPVIGSVARLEPIKRFDVLLRAASLIKVEPRPVIVIAGDGSQRADLLRLTETLGLSNRVLWLGHRDDSLRVHHAFDVFVQSSDSEGLPNTVLEAMALETPVVATDVGGTCELIESGVHGLLVPPGSATALASAVEQTLQDPGGAACRVRAARIRIESNLSFERRIASVERVYAQLMNAGGPGHSAFSAN